jgi:phospholipid/cholesterol/gamma-HCH transport system substrate-binding protein
METRAHYAAVGAFVLAMVVLAFAAVVWLARGALTTEFAHYDMYFHGPVTGLRAGAEVDYNGVPVGKVADINIVEYDKKYDSEKIPQCYQGPAQNDNDEEEENSAATLIKVQADIRPRTPIRLDAKASVETNILSGVSYIEIAGGKQQAEQISPAVGDDGRPIICSHRSPLASVTARAPQLLEKLSDATDRLNQLLGDKNQKAISATLTNLQSFSQGLADRKQDIAEMLQNANTAARGANKLLDDIDRSYNGPDGLGQRASSALADFDRLAKNLNDTNAQLQATLQDVRPGLRNFSQQTLGNIDNLVTETRQLVTGLNRVSDQLEGDPSRVLFGDRRQGYRPQ